MATSCAVDVPVPQDECVMDYLQLLQPLPSLAAVGAEPPAAAEAVAPAAVPSKVKVVVKYTPLVEGFAEVMRAKDPNFSAGTGGKLAADGLRALAVSNILEFNIIVKAWAEAAVPDLEEHQQKHGKLSTHYANQLKTAHEALKKLKAMEEGAPIELACPPPKEKAKAASPATSGGGDGPAPAAPATVVKAAPKR